MATSLKCRPDGANSEQQRGVVVDAPHYHFGVAREQERDDGLEGEIHVQLGSVKAIDVSFRCRGAVIRMLPSGDRGKTSLAPSGRAYRGECAPHRVSLQRAKVRTASEAERKYSMSSSIQQRWPSAVSSSTAPQARVRSCRLQNLSERLGLHRLVNEEVKACDGALAFHRRFHAASQAHEEHTRQRSVLLGRGKNLAAILAWHLKIQEDQCRLEELGDPKPHLAAESEGYIGWPTN